MKRINKVEDFTELFGIAFKRTDMHGHTVIDLDFMDKVAKELWEKLAIVITKDGKVFLNFDKKVGKVLLKKMIEILEIIEKDVSAD